MVGGRGGTYEDEDLAYAPHDEEECEPHGCDAMRRAQISSRLYKLGGSTTSQAPGVLGNSTERRSRYPGIRYRRPVHWRYTKKPTYAKQNRVLDVGRAVMGGEKKKVSLGTGKKGGCRFPVRWERRANNMYKGGGGGRQAEKEMVGSLGGRQFRVGGCDGAAFGGR